MIQCRRSPRFYNVWLWPATLRGVVQSFNYLCLKVDFPSCGTFLPQNMNVDGHKSSKSSRKANPTFPLRSIHLSLLRLQFQLYSPQQIWFMEDGHQPCFKCCTWHHVLPRIPWLLWHLRRIPWCTSLWPSQFQPESVFPSCCGIYTQSFEHTRRYETIADYSKSNYIIFWPDMNFGRCSIVLFFLSCRW